MLHVMKTNNAILARKQLSAYAKTVEVYLNHYFDEELSSTFGVSKKEKQVSIKALKHIKEHNLRPAKRLRASFVYYGYHLFRNGKEVDLIKASMAIELVHTALLIHDDIMDQDKTRRGQPTTHRYYQYLHQNNNFRFNSEHYGNSMAINTGDAALCLGFEILGNCNFNPENKLKALNRLLRGIVNTAYGQSYDITLEAIGKADQKDIIDLHHAKTAIYTYENPLQIGALLANANSNDLEILSKYAIPGGIAFQLQDDILGLYGNPEKTGKPAHSDLRQGKMTLLIIKALENGSTLQVKKLRQIWGNRNLSKKDANMVRKIVKETGSLDHSKKLALKWAKKAQDVIPCMIKRKWNFPAINYLDGITKYIIEREM